MAQTPTPVVLTDSPGAIEIGTDSNPLSVSIVSGGGGGSDPSVSATGSAIPADATMVGGSDGTDLRPIATDASGQVKVLVENAPSVAVSNFPATQPISGTVTANVGTGTQPVSGTVAISNFPATQPVSGTFFQTTQPVSGSVAVSNFPVTQPVSGTVTANDVPPTLTKGTQGSTGFSVQDLKDAGRNPITLWVDVIAGITTEALATMNITKGLVAQSAATSYTVSAGKTFRIQSLRSE